MYCRPRGTQGHGPPWGQGTPSHCRVKRQNVPDSHEPQAVILRLSQSEIITRVCLLHLVLRRQSGCSSLCFQCWHGLMWGAWAWWNQSGIPPPCGPSTTKEMEWRTLHYGLRKGACADRVATQVGPQRPAHSASDEMSGCHKGTFWAQTHPLTFLIRRDGQSLSRCWCFSAWVWLPSLNTFKYI